MLKHTGKAAWFVIKWVIRLPVMAVFLPFVVLVFLFDVIVMALED